jgi:hypothetical protein
MAEKLASKDLMLSPDGTVAPPPDDVEELEPHAVAKIAIAIPHPVTASRLNCRIFMLAS